MALVIAAVRSHVQDSCSPSRAATRFSARRWWVHDAGIDVAEFFEAEEFSGVIGIRKVWLFDKWERAGSGSRIRLLSSV